MLNCCVWRHGRQANQRGSDYGGFLKQSFKVKQKVVIKTTREVVSTNKVLWSLICSTKYEQSKITGRFVGPSSSRGGRRLHCRCSGTVLASATVNSDCSTSTSGVRDWVAEIETLFDYATPRWRSESSVEWMHAAKLPQSVTTSPHAFTRLQSLQLVTSMSIEPVNSLFIQCCLWIDCLIVIHIT